MAGSYLSLIVAILGFRLPLAACFQKVKDHSIYDYYVLEISRGDVESFIDNNHGSGIEFENSLLGFEDSHQVISIPKHSYSKKRDVLFDDELLGEIHHLKPERRLFKRMPQPIDTSLAQEPSEEEIWEGYSDEQIARLKSIMDEYQINDPLFKKQWHLVNSFYPGNDLNVLPVWSMNITGDGVTVAIVDDGLDYENKDLKDNFNAKGSYDFNDKSQLPKPRLADDYHGTRCAGEIAAVKDNEYCGLGVAYNAKVSGLRILSGEITPEEEAAAMIYEMNENDIYSCSWGPTDNGREMEKPSELVRMAMEKGIKEGRDSKGNIYVFASGNGANLGDNCNYDGYTNSIHSITVGAIDWKGNHAPYSESCSALLTVTYSSGSNEYIHSTDINNVCADQHGGTSAAAPLAAGVFALVLEANKDLTWRDVQYLTIESSIAVDEENGGWQQPSNYFNKKYSHMYGFGKIDAFEIVSKSMDWVNVNEQVQLLLDQIDVNEKSSSESEYIESKIVVTEQQFADFKHLEHITVTIDADSKVRGFTEIDLIAPDGSISHLGIPRRLDKRNTGFPNWKFMSVVHWGTNAIGEWTLRTRVTSNANEINLKSWQFELFGEKRNELPEPVEEQPETDPITTTTLSPATSTTYNTEDPTHTTAVQESSGSVSTTASPHKTLQKSKKILKAHHYFGLLVLILVILGFYYLLFINKKKKFQRLRAETYEFDIIDNDSEYNASIVTNQDFSDINSNQSGEGNGGSDTRMNFDISDVEVEDPFDFNEDAEVINYEDIPEASPVQETNQDNTESSNEHTQATVQSSTEDSYKNPFIDHDGQ